MLTSRKLTGQFPNYEAVLPRDNNKFVIVRSEDLMSLHPARRAVRRRALRRHQDSPGAERAQALVVRPPTPASRKTPSKPRTTTIRSSSASTAQYLIDFLKAIGNTGEVRLEFKDAQSAGQMRPEDGNEDVKYRYILMPMRI